MAIGLGKMFGFHFLENFNYPYIAQSITDFWRRWHISLSTWFRDYVYIPLGGNRVAKNSRLIFNLFVVWVLTGIWHGANWTFMLWGLYYFILLVIERFTGLAKKQTGPLGHLYTMFFVIIGWVLFRTESLALTGRYLSAMFGINTPGLTDELFFTYFNNGKWVILTGLIFATPIIPLCKKKLAVYPYVYQVVSSISLVSLFCISLLICIKSTYNPFIYFNF
jgi:D-alanyl-lipoteichoic acid acyltransferase DltB (MBOAT superfamily)